MIRHHKALKMSNGNTYLPQKSNIKNIPIFFNITFPIAYILNDLHNK